ELRAGLGESLVSAQFPDRTAVLAGLADGGSQPTIDELEGLWMGLLEAMNESGKVVSFEAPVVAADGAAEPRRVTRVGPFTAVSDGRFLRYLADQDRLAELPRQPANRHRELARGLESAQEGPVAMAVDPSGGAYLGLLVQTPDAVERVRQGGIIGYIILGLGVAGLLVVLERLAYLGFVGRRVHRQQADLTSPNTRNPLGRVLAVADDLKGTDPETLEGKLDEAILRELPPLERGPGLIKLLAAVAPLLGLLGTVTGMIATFQSISLFGTGDPRLMADGISQALVTTMLGLTVAIPLLFLQTLVASRSKSLVQVLDEQGAALLAERLEREAA
ncbi:MAG TPA: MotA/TolQ/ExbB proton channel family protein, partial [Gammaproteobacteria bacterium]|nr:MotA/TolQ/ExbB proton channel family protein [Gammaproteobacteria bacterium]